MTISPNYTGATGHNRWFAPIFVIYSLISPVIRSINGVMADMGIELVEITGGQRDRLLVLEEGHFVELKGVEVSTKKLGRTVSAFANATGGDLYVGIGETELMGVKIRTWHGFRDQEGANGHLQSLEALFPLGAEYSYEFLSCPGSVGVVLHITVQRTPQVARAHDKKGFC